MPAIDYSSHVNRTAPAPPPAAAKKAETPHFSFGDLLDIINPLQHIPVVSTLYRAISGDGIGVPEKIAGDTLYGGVIGLVVSLADTAYKGITGEYAGDTVLAFLTGDGTDAPVQVAAAPETPAQVTPAQLTDAPDLSALMGALSRKGVDAGTAARAASAYRFTIGLTARAPLLPQS
ncbi:MAG TPA: hypothetical protein VGC27_01090 [Rhizomicrobium sp.]